MSLEITYKLQMALANGSLNDSYASQTLKADQESTSARLIRNTMTITNVDVLIEPGSVLLPGWSVFKSLSTTATDYIDIGNYTGGTLYPLIRLYGGDEQLVRIGIAAANLYAVSNIVGGVELFYIIYDQTP